MHVAHINFFRTPQGRSATEVLADWRSLADIAESVASSGIQVSVIQAAVRSESLKRNGISYHFFATDPTQSATARSYDYARLLSDMKAEVLHVHGLGFMDEVLAVGRRLPKLPILIQDHADHPPPWCRRRRWKRGLSVASGVAFTDSNQALPFASAGLFDSHLRLFSIPESSSRFMPGDRAAARNATGLYGEPCVLWVGHLSPGKDPLTVLDGVAEAARHLPNLQLWCCFGTAPLLDDVRQRIARDPLLGDRVHLLGQVPHGRIEKLLQAADLFVLGSHAESCGYAVLEALACGVPPVITDIPSFRALTDGGKIGNLWPPGDARQFAESLMLAVTDPTPSTTVRAYFDTALSPQAVGRKWADAYTQLLASE